MSMPDDFNNRGQRPERTLGEAANRWVTYQMIMGIVGLILFVLFVLLFFLPMWNRFPMP